MTIYRYPKLSLYCLFQIIFCMMLATTHTMALEPQFATSVPRCAIPAMPPEPEACCINDPSQCGFCNPYARLEFGYHAGRFIGVDDDYAEVGLFVPLLLTNKCILFIDDRGYRFEHSQWGYSLGIGARRFLCDGHIIGANLYFDYFRTQLGNSFNRIGIGLEYLGPCWDFRLNAYLPLEYEIKRFNFRTITNGNGAFLTIFDSEAPRSRGFDAEIGVPLFSYCNNRLYAATGTYFYDRIGVSDFWGGYARLELDIGYFITLHARTSYDRIYHSRTEVAAVLTIPFDILCNFCNWGCCRNHCLDRLTQPVRRFGQMFTNECIDFVNNYPTTR